VGEPLLADTVKPKAIVRLAYKDAGLDYYGNGIVATEAMIKENPAVVKAFVRATLKGMRDAFANPAEAGAILNKYHKQISPEVAQGETELVRELAIVPGQRTGAIDQARVKSTIDIMAKSFPVKTAVSPEEMFVSGFVE
jgi:NitT/TauT family transport system substrate-binding protein